MASARTALTSPGDSFVLFEGAVGPVGGARTARAALASPFLLCVGMVVGRISACGPGPVQAVGAPGCTVRSRAA